MEHNTFLVQQLAVWQAIAQHSSSTALQQAAVVQAAQGWPQPHAAQPQQFPSQPFPPPLQASIMQPQRSCYGADRGAHGPPPHWRQLAAAPSDAAALLTWRQHGAQQPQQPVIWRAASKESATTLVNAGQALQQPQLAVFPARAQQGSCSPAEFLLGQTLQPLQWQQHVVQPQPSNESQVIISQSSEVAAAGGAERQQVPQEWDMPVDMAAIGSVQQAAQECQTSGDMAAAGSMQQQAPQTWLMCTAQPPITETAAATVAPAIPQHWWQQTAQQQPQLAPWEGDMQFGDDGEI